MGVLNSSVCLICLDVRICCRTDYACKIFHDALRTGHHECFLRSDTRLPMMYVDDCLRSIAEYLVVPDEQLRLRTYNVHAMSFTPDEIAQAIRRYVPELKVTYKPDARQYIGQSVVIFMCERHKFISLRGR